MREDRQVPKRLRYGKFRKNLEEFKTRAETPATAYRRTKINIDKILKETQDELQSQQERFADRV